MKLSSGAKQDNLFNVFFFSVSSAVTLICMKLFDVWANKLSLKKKKKAQFLSGPRSLDINMLECSCLHMWSLRRGNT